MVGWLFFDSIVSLMLDSIQKSNFKRKAKNYTLLDSKFYVKRQNEDPLEYLLGLEQ